MNFQKMKTSLYVFFVSITLCFGQSSNKTIEMPSDFCAKEKIIKLAKGDVLKVSCDSVVVMTQKRHQFYKEIKANLIDSTGVGYYKQLIASYEKSIETYKKDYEKLYANCEKSDGLTTQLINRSLSTLDGTQKLLSYTQASLDQTIKSLEAAEKLLKQQRKKSVGQKILLGACGASVGILAGILIAK